MKTTTVKLSLRLMIAGLLLLIVAQSVTAQTTDNDSTVDAAEKSAEGMAKLGAGIALGLAAVGAGYSQSQIGAAAVGMVAEDSSKFGTGLIFTALPESIVILGLLGFFL